MEPSASRKACRITSSTTTTNAEFVKTSSLQILMTSNGKSCCGRKMPDRQTRRGELEKLRASLQRITQVRHNPPRVRIARNSRIAIQALNLQANIVISKSTEYFLSYYLILGVSRCTTHEHRRVHVKAKNVSTYTGET